MSIELLTSIWFGLWAFFKGVVFVLALIPVVLLIVAFLVELWWLALIAAVVFLFVAAKG